MPTKKVPWDIFSPEQKKACIHSIMAFFEEQRDEEIGLIATEQLFDAVMETSFDHIYNKGVLDAQNMIKEKLESLTTDIDVLIKT